MMIITASFMLKKTHQNTLFNYETARKMHSEGDLATPPSKAQLQWTRNASGLRSRWKASRSRP